MTLVTTVEVTTATMTTAAVRTLVRARAHDPDLVPSKKAIDLEAEHME